MNNIEILIDNFEQLKKNKFIIESIDPEFFFKFGENLIQENKELKKENLELHKEINQRIKLKLENERCADKDFIPKSKVKEKIEELEKERKRKDEEDTINPFYDQIDITHIIEVLQELLKEE